MRWMRAFLLSVLFGGVVGVATWACNPNSIGRPCVNPQGSDVRGTQVSSPALECPSRLCLISPANGTSPGAVDGGGSSEPRATCTADCQSDGDCAPETSQYCKSGFACAVATQVGDFCCRKLCICKDDLQDNINRDPVDGGVITPTACDPKTYQNSPNPPACKNIKLTP
jgi:hypothetical protein